jgi:hypothetical protein
LFYEYHKQFSFKVAQYLIQQGQKIDWSIKDAELYMSIFTGQKANACGVCSSVAHLTNFCPEKTHSGFNKPGLATAQRSSVSKQVDRRGRPIISDSLGKQLCNNYNTIGGCVFQEACRFAHICTVCKGTHPRYTCDSTTKGQGDKTKGKPRRSGQSIPTIP